MVVVLPTVVELVCGIIAEISLFDAFSVAPDCMRVGGISIPFHAVDPVTVIPVTPESVRLPVTLLVSLESDVTTRIVPLRSSVLPVAIIAPVRVVAPVSARVHPVKATGALAVANDPVEVDEAFPKSSVTDMA